MHNKHARANVADYVLQSSALSCQEPAPSRTFFFPFIIYPGKG
jgi:hypothetical protein